MSDTGKNRSTTLEADTGRGHDAGPGDLDASARDAQGISPPHDALDSPDSTVAQDSGRDTSPKDDASADTHSPPDTAADATADAATSDTSDTAHTPDTSAPLPPEKPEFLSRHDTSALWVWADAETAHAFTTNRWNMAENLINFASAPHGSSAHAINRFYFEARTYSRDNIFDAMRPITYDPLLTPGEQAHLRAFNARAHAAGIAVEYLDGQAIWLASDANAQWPKQVCRDVVTFNKTTSLNAERLAGVHFDIEPHTVGGTRWDGHWWQDRLPGGYNAAWTQRWMDIMTSCRATLDAYAQETGHYMTLSLDLGADIAYYNKPLLSFLNAPDSPVDYIALMNYYDNTPNQNDQPSFFFGWHDGEAMTGGVEQNLALWTNTPLVFGVEVNPLPTEYHFMTFDEEGYNATFAVIDTLTAGYRRARVMGYAVHSWGGYIAMEP
ncbi:hypothetical protein DN745_05080 [Bradymonas sediminis]|uniref:GH26 domain-containing protein n=1 Tax=Bradymonas sediminis TaxID=1548548 RepID=A0A2Z4FIK8_9DELT|nr:hypothetical protein DN745_05080 [Bradymonas sediminis]